MAAYTTCNGMFKYEHPEAWLDDHMGIEAARLEVPFNLEKLPHGGQRFRGVCKRANLLHMLLSSRLLGMHATVLL